MERLPYFFLVFVGGICLATFLTSETLAAGSALPCITPLLTAGL